MPFPAACRLPELHALWKNPESWLKIYGNKSSNSMEFLNIKDFVGTFWLVNGQQVHQVHDVFASFYRLNEAVH